MDTEDSRDLADGEHLLTIVIPGRPATKKTHQQLVYVSGRPRILPSKQYAAYEKLSAPVIQSLAPVEPYDFGVSIDLKIWLNNWVVGDHCGYLQCIGDLLEKYGVVSNDSWICWTAASHWFQGVDKDNPRVEIIITRKRHPKETRKAS